MATTGPSFVYSHAVEDLADPLSAILVGADPEVVRKVTAIVEMLRDRDHDVEDALTSTLAGQRDVTTITATAGGATITFAKTFNTTPVVVACMGDSAAGLTVNVVDSSRSITSFKAQVFDTAGVEVVVGSFKVAWIAA